MRVVGKASARVCRVHPLPVGCEVPTQPDSRRERRNTYEAVMIQAKLVCQVRAIVIQGVAFELPLEFMWRIEETAAAAIQQRKAAAEITRFIFHELQGRN